MDFPKKQGQRLIPDYLLDYATELHTNHPDPTESWGGSGGSEYTAGNGIEINNNVISVDNTVAKKSEIPTNYVTLDTEQTITGLKTIGQTNGTLSEVDFSGFTFKLVNKAINSTESEIKISNSSYGGYQHPNIYSSKGLYVNLAKIKLGDDGNNTYGITMPDSTTWESDKVLATIDDIPSLDGYATETWVQEQGYATPSSLARVATTGSYNDLNDKPTFATVATSGSYNDLLDKPTIPDTSKFVTTDTEQTISGFKTFNGGLILPGLGGAYTMQPLGVGAFRFNDTTTQHQIDFMLPIEKSGTEYTIATTDDIHNPTITFTQGGTTKGTITLNQSGDQTIEFDAGGGGGGGKLYLHKITIKKWYLYDKNNEEVASSLFIFNNIVTSSNQPMTLDTYKGYFTSDNIGYNYGCATSGRVSVSQDSRGSSSIISVNFKNNFAGINFFYARNGSGGTSYIEVKFDSVDGFEDIVMEV